MSRNNKNFFPGDYFLPLFFALFKLMLHLFVNARGGYGYFRDELYYIACSNHLDWGYVDQPPLSVFLLAMNRLLFGDSIFAMRLLPAIAGAFTVFLTGLMVREIGGGRKAQVLACLAMIISPINLGMNGYYSMNTFDILIWISVAYYVVRLFKEQRSYYWIILGVLLGVGLLNKVSILWLGFGLLVGLLMTPHRHWFRTRYPWLAGLIAVMIFLPNIVWNFAHDFAHLEFMRNATEGKYSGLSPATFLAGQIFLQNPLTLPLWLSGLFFYFLTTGGKPFRALGYIYLAVCFILLANQHTKAEYLSPAYGILFAAGGLMIEQWSLRAGLRWLNAAFVVLLVTGFIAVPLAVPILPVETYIRYADALGVSPSTSESKQLGKLPQHYADMFGWDEMVGTVVRVYDTLPDSEKSHCVIYGQNYGEAAAVDFLGRTYHLPKAISGHNTYWLWGPGNYDSNKVVILIGGRKADHLQAFEHVELADTIHSVYAMPYENDLPVYVCRKLKVPLQDIWARIKNYS